MNQKASKSADKALFAFRDTSYSTHPSFSMKNSLNKAHVLLNEASGLQATNLTAHFKQQQNVKTPEKGLYLRVDSRTGKLCYPSLLFRKKALKESLKKSKGSVIKTDSESEDYNEDNINESFSHNNFRLKEIIAKQIDNNRMIAKAKKSAFKQMYGENDIEENFSPAFEADEIEYEVTETQKYDMYEDWRIIETMEDHINSHGTKGRLSKSLWKDFTDPMTGDHLLGGRRSTESMRERYKRWLIVLTPEDIEELREFAQKSTEEDMRNSVCLFRRVEGERKFMGIDKNSVDSTKKTIKTPHRSSGKKSPAMQYTEEKQTWLRAKPVHNQVREKLVFSERKEFGEDKNVKIEQSGKSSVRRNLQTKEKVSPLKRIWTPANEMDEIETAQKQRIIDVEKVWKMNQEGGFRPRGKRVLLREEEEEDTADGDKESFREMPSGVRLDFSQINLKDRFNSGLENKRYLTEEVSDSDEEVLEGNEEQWEIEKVKKLDLAKANLNVNIYVDLDNKTRHFVQEKKSEEERQSAGILKLLKVAKKYGTKLEDAMKLLHGVSGNYQDLKLYLKGGDKNLLWTEDDDHGLMLNNRTAIKYLKIIKGDQRVERRRMYLLGRCEKMKNASHA